MVWPSFSTAVIASGAIGLLSAYLAHKRGRNPLGWFLVGFFFGLFGIMAIFFAPFPKRKPEPVVAKPEPKPYLFGPTDKFWYYIDELRNSQGPMSYNALSAAWKQGKVTPSTYIWNEELPEWKPLQELIRIKSP